MRHAPIAQRAFMQSRATSGARLAPLGTREQRRPARASGASASAQLQKRAIHAHTTCALAGSGRSTTSSSTVSRPARTSCHHSGAAGRRRSDREGWVLRSAELSVGGRREIGWALVCGRRGCAISQRWEGGGVAHAPPASWWARPAPWLRGRATHARAR
eukprot:5729895-Prymnesium_polylepis.1